MTYISFQPGNIPMAYESSKTLSLSTSTATPSSAETVPPNYFRLVQFSNLDADREAHSIPASQAVLTDVYGCIKSIRPPHPQYIKSQNKTGVKCEIVLENVGRETLTIVFLGKLAREFNIDAITSLPPPVLAVFTVLKMTLYNQRIIANNYDHTCVLLNPPTAWTDAYKAEFSKPGDKTMIQGDFHIFETTEPKDIIFVQALTGLDPTEYKARSVLCKGQIIKIRSNGWWYRRCSEPGCYRQCFKMEDLDDKYRCRTHGVQAAVPCFRVNRLIGDKVSDVTVTVMGNQAEQLFGSKLETLRSKRVYATDQVIPPKISAVIGQVHVFEVKGNAYGEWIAVSVAPNEHDAATSSTTLLPEMALQTPEKASIKQKRTLESSPKTLFPEAKKTRSETKEISDSSSTIQKNDRLD